MHGRMNHPSTLVNEVHQAHVPDRAAYCLLFYPLQIPIREAMQRVSRPEALSEEDIRPVCLRDFKV